MPITPNVAKRRLAEGKLVLGLGVRQCRSVDIGLVARISGFDYIFIDCEHGAIDLETAAQLSVAALGQGVSPIVRVPGTEASHPVRILDNGAQGVVIPHVQSAAQAREIVNNLKYPPVGHRSLSTPAAIGGYESIPIAQFAKEANDELLIVAMIESPEAVEAADSIAAVDGIDSLLIGTNDLCAEMGIHGQFGHERVTDAYAKVIAACKKHGKHPGMAGIRDNALNERYIGMGARLVLAAVDVGLIIEAGTTRTKFLRSLK